MFCEKCGTQLVDNICPRCVQFEQMPVNAHEDRFRSFFLSPDEKMVAVLGNSYLENFFKSGTIKNGYAVVSDKRVYFQGKQYCVDGEGNVEETYNSRVVDVRDVTGTGFDHYVDDGYKYRAIVFGVFMGISIVSMILILLAPIFLGLLIYSIYKYYQSKITVILIQYAGGEIGFDVNWFHQQEIDLFQKQLRLAKDKIYEKKDNPTINTAPTQTSVADELSKLAGLLEKGLISQEEFEKMKKNLL